MPSSGSISSPDAPAKPARILPPFKARTLLAFAFITVSPSVTWPSPPRATCPSRRTHRIVVLRMPLIALVVASRPRMGLMVHLLQPFHRRMSIHLRGAERGVAQQLLDGPQIGAGVEQMRRERVAQRVHMQVSRPRPCAPAPRES